MEPARVSPIVKGLAALAGVAAVAGLLWYLSRPSPASQARADAARLAKAGTPAPAASAPAKPIDKVTRLAAEERKQLAERIENARAARAAATSAPPRPRLAEGTGSDEDTGTAISKTQIRDAMRELIPYITECYEAALPTLPSKSFKMTAELTLTGDPDIGTIVDAKALADSDGKALPAALDDCFRSTFMQMGLPPLAEGDTLEVRYPFEFREI